MFRAFSRPSSSGRPARPRKQHDYHHDTKVKPEAATAVIELLMMGGKKLETCWAVNKRQNNKLENCCIWLVIYLNQLIHSFFLKSLNDVCWKADVLCSFVLLEQMFMWQKLTECDHGLSEYNIPDTYFEWIFRCTVEHIFYRKFCFPSNLKLNLASTLCNFRVTVQCETRV